MMYQDNFKIGFYIAIGYQGSGKTALITKLAIDNYFNNKNRKIYSNYYLFGVPYQKITLGNKHEKDNGAIDILEALDDDPRFFDGSIMLLDELHVYLNSLDYTTKTNRQLQGFFSQIRKRKILLLATTQFIMHVDPRVRRQISTFFEMENVNNSVFKVTTYRLPYGALNVDILNQYHVDLSKYFNYYDTNEIIL